MQGRGVLPNGEKVRELRKNKMGWSQDKLAEMAKCSKRTIENVEQSRSVNPGTLREIADALNVQFCEVVESLDGNHNTLDSFALGLDNGTLMAASNQPGSPNGTPVDGTKQIEITLPGNLNHFTAEDQEKIIQSIKELLKTDADIKIRKVGSGSIKLTLELPVDDADKLIEAYIAGLLQEKLGITNVEPVILETENVPTPVHHEVSSFRPPCRSLLGISIVATGSFVPDAVLTNEQLHHQLGFDSDWIVKRTGIMERRHALPHQATSDLCVEAARRCLVNAPVSPGAVDLLLVATSTPDMLIPSSACYVQSALQLKCPAFDLQAACAGFVFAMITGGAYIKAGIAKSVLIIGGECLSRIVNPEDIKTYPIFGDAAGAVLLSSGNPKSGFLSFCSGTDGTGGDLFLQPAGGSRFPPTHELIDKGRQYITMDGRGMFRWSVAILCDSIMDVLKDADVSPDDVDLFVVQQANCRIINAAMDVLKIPRDKVFQNIEKYGNTGAASVPLSLDEARQEGRIKPGNLVVLAGFGAGLSWGTGLMRLT
ncbi:MAG TPA: beta-ketoacyl-ACP synthase 3 [Gemmataceae bacterium]|nr:beta-ketoacyl-ACP synthase 3 [Gemmataceae bacterium]